MAIQKRKINGRDKGHAYERHLVKVFKELGFTECATSRYESKKMDDLKVDLVNTGVMNVQAKAVEKLGSLHTILEEMPKDSNFNLVFHKRNRKGTIVAMTEDDFFRLIKLARLI